MKKVHKWFVTFLMSLTLFMGTSFKCTECHGTGFPTIDISNLIQNILGFFEEQLREGSLLDGVTKMQDMSERYDAWLKKIAQVKQVLAYVRGGVQVADDILAIIKLGEFVYEDLQSFNTVEQYLNNDTDALLLMNTGISLARSYMNITNILMRVTQERVEQFMSLDQSDAAQLIKYLDETVEEMYRTYYKVRRMFMRRYVNYYHDYQIARMISDTDKFVHRWFF